MPQRKADEEEIRNAEQAFAPEGEIEGAEDVEPGRQRPATEDEIKEAEKK